MKSNVVVFFHERNDVMFDLVAGIEVYLLVVYQMQKLEVYFGVEVVLLSEVGFCVVFFDPLP